MPTREDVKKAINLMHRHSEWEFFFNNLNSPDWLEPLDEEKVFSNPANILITENGTKIPVWPPAKYLIKIAPLKAEKVLEIIQKIPDTDNTRIYEDFVDAAIAMPPDIAILLYKDTLQWLNKPYQFLLPKKVATLTGIFFQFGYNKQALCLSNKLLDVSLSNFQGKSDQLVFRNGWEYNELIKLIVPNLKSIDTKKLIIIILCDKLEEAIRSEGNPNKEEIGFVDYSSVWRSSIESSNLYSNESIKDILINWIRDLCDTTLKDDPGSLTYLIKILCEKDFPIFSRLGLYLVKNQFVNNNFIISLLLNDTLAKSSDVWHEYAILLRDKFPVFDPNAKGEILDFISKLNFSTVDDMNLNEHNQHRHYRYYYIIQNDLKGKWKIEFDKMKEKYGDIAHPEYLAYFTDVREIRPTSPISIDELSTKSIDEIRNFLIDWQPPVTDLYGESTYNLVQVLEKGVVLRYQEFSENLSLFKINRSWIVRSLIQGFNRALTENKIFNWERLLEYLLWAVDHKEDVLDKTDANTKMRWSGIKEITCRFLEKGFFATENKLPISSRGLVWEIINFSLEDLDPDLAREEKIKDQDFYSIAINSARGVALECAIRYGLWIMESFGIKKENSSQKDYKELFVALSKHLDTNLDKSKSVHSIYGRWLPWIFLLDSEWTKKNINQIFPIEESQTSYRFAAWDTYLLYSSPFDEVFEAIENEYITALDTINENSIADDNKSTTRLIEHIILFYLSGKIALDSPIITKIYERANLQIRSYIVNFMGRILRSEVSHRAMDFWSFRVKNCNEINDWKELIEFGWWDRIVYQGVGFLSKRQSY